jgi:hypothetical protein
MSASFAFGEMASNDDVLAISAVFRRALELEIDFHLALYQAAG